MREAIYNAARANFSPRQLYNTAVNPTLEGGGRGVVNYILKYFSFTYNKIINNFIKIIKLYSRRRIELSQRAVFAIDVFLYCVCIYTYIQQPLSAISLPLLCLCASRRTTTTIQYTTLYMCIYFRLWLPQRQKCLFNSEKRAPHTH